MILDRCAFPPTARHVPFFLHVVGPDLLSIYLNGEVAAYRVA